MQFLIKLLIKLLLTVCVCHVAELRIELNKNTMNKKQIFSKSLQANKDFVASLTKEQLEELMKPFDNYEVEQCDIHVVVVPKGTLCRNCGSYDIYNCFLTDVKACNKCHYQD